MHVCIHTVKTVVIAVGSYIYIWPPPLLPLMMMVLLLMVLVLLLVRVRVVAAMVVGGLRMLGMIFAVALLVEVRQHRER